MTTATLLELNAYGGRWHVLVDGKGVMFTGQTKADCLAYCRRRQLTVA